MSNEANKPTALIAQDILLTTHLDALCLISHTLYLPNYAILVQELFMLHFFTKCDIRGIELQLKNPTKQNSHPQPPTLVLFFVLFLKMELFHEHLDPREWKNNSGVCWKQRHSFRLESRALLTALPLISQKYRMVLCWMGP